jgi:hypothetical protein
MVVMFVLVTVVADAAFLGKSGNGIKPNSGSIGLTEHQRFQGVQGATQVPASKFRKGFEDLRSSLAIMRTQSPLLFTHCFLKYHCNGIRVDRFKAKEMTAAQQGRVDVKAGVVGRGSNEANIARLDIGKQQVLL